MSAVMFIAEGKGKLKSMSIKVWKNGPHLVVNVLNWHHSLIFTPLKVINL